VKTLLSCIAGCRANTGQCNPSNANITEHEPIRYAEIPRKAAKATEWLSDHAPALANVEPGSDKLN
jgi:hypothetical protein